MASDGWPRAGNKEDDDESDDDTERNARRADAYGEREDDRR